MDHSDLFSAMIELMLDSVVDLSPTESTLAPASSDLVEDMSLVAFVPDQEDRRIGSVEL